MGVVNVTPDSFSDGGCWPDPQSAISHARELVAQGADVIDIGGESTRPNADVVSLDEELSRVIPVVAAIAGDARVSIDTMKPAVAVAAVAAGASILNDVSGSMEIAHIAAAHDVAWICMHMQGTPRTMQHNPTYDAVVNDVKQFLVERAEAGRSVGVKEVWIDPGIGFGKTTQHNLALLRHLDLLGQSGFPIVVGTSRKSTLGRLTAAADARADIAPVDQRLEASIASAVWAWRHGAAMVRVHDVAATVRARALSAALDKVA